jgi:hypothetical protein
MGEFFSLNKTWRECLLSPKSMGEYIIYSSWENVFFYLKEWEECLLPTKHGGVSSLYKAWVSVFFLHKSGGVSPSSTKPGECL